MSYLPESVESWVSIGLETGLADDRLVALQAANHEDGADPSRETSYGLEVAKIFMDQLGLEFEPGTEDIKERSEIFKGPRQGIIMQEVYKAVGAAIGVRSRIHEFVGSSTGWQHSLDIIYIDEQYLGRMAYTPALNAGRPFYFEQCFANDRSRDNLNTAILAIEGIVEDGVPGDGAMLATLGTIRGLEEREA